jgi:hypothetical protein
MVGRSVGSRSLAPKAGHHTQSAPNQALEPTPSSLRYALASGRGSPPALDGSNIAKAHHETKSNSHTVCVFAV